MNQSMAGAYRTLEAWRGNGTVQAIGIGVNDCASCLRALREADFDFLLLAGRLTLLDGEGFAEVLPEAARRGVGVIAAAPFNSGILAIGARPEATFFYQSPPADVLERTRRIEDICARHAVPLPAAALQYALRHPAVSCVLAGYRSVGQVAENLSHAGQAIPEAFWGELHDAGLPATRLAQRARSQSIVASARRPSSACAAAFAKALAQDFETMREVVPAAKIPAN